MAGPTATILLPNALTEAQACILSDTIHSISDVVGGDDFFVITTRPIGGTENFAPRPFVLTAGENGDPLTFGLTESEISQIRALVGIEPTAALTFAAMCNEPIDHEILARLCAHLADTFEGVVDLNGTIAHYSGGQSGLYSIEYQNHLYQTASRHICRPEFLVAYVSNQEFRMVN